MGISIDKIWEKVNFFLNFYVLTIGILFGLFFREKITIISIFCILLGKIVILIEKSISGNGCKVCLDRNKDFVLVTGGGEGLGYCIVKELNLKGIKVISWELNQKKNLGNFTQESPLLIRMNCDVSDRNCVRKCAAYVKKIGKVTVLVNNAGVAKYAKILSKDQNLEETFGTNVFSHVYTAQEFVPDMILNNRGHIVNITSVLGYISPVGFGEYAASKSAAISLHESLTYEIEACASANNKPNNVKTHLVVVGQLGAPAKMFKNVSTPNEFFAPLVDTPKLAKDIVKILERGYAENIYAPLYANYICLLSFFPKFLIRILRSFSGVDRT